MAGRCMACGGIDSWNDEDYADLNPEDCLVD
jgi:hypothetical protein